MTEPQAGSDRLLGGTVIHRQRVDGHRSGIEPVLLAASLDPRPGTRVVEFGTAAGATLLCLAARCPGITATGVEIDPALAALAVENVAANGWSERIAIRAAPIEQHGLSERFDHALANPPWHDPAGTVSADPRQERARRAGGDLLDRWIAALADLLKPRGTLHLALPSTQLQRACAACGTAGLGTLALLPLWPHRGRPAKLMLLRAVRGGRGGSEIRPGLVLHEPAGGFTPEADAILRAGAPLVW